MRAAVTLALVAACGAAPADTRAWKLTRAEWERIVVPAYRPLYDEYVHAFEEERARLATRAMTRTWTMRVRSHFAGDPELTLAQARTRWALPVMYPAFVIRVDDTSLDAVFVRTPRGWGAITGLDNILVRHAAVLDATCARYLEVLGNRRCQEISWMIADAALQKDRPRLAHACALAAAACARP